MVDRIAEIAGRRPALVEGDSGNRDTLRRLLAQYPVDATIHFAGFKAVGESVAKPLAYYGNNVSGTVVLLECLEEAGARRLVFSSSATVYGDPASVPIREDFPTGPTNPYGRTKWHIEHMLNDLAVASPEWSIGILRYFNPVGAHASGRIGENPRGIPNNLMPFVTQVAVGKRPGCTPGTWAPARATRCWTSSRPSRRPAGSPSRTRSSIAAPATWRSAMPIRRLRPRCWAGARSVTCSRCVPTAGTGSRRIRTATERRD